MSSACSSEICAVVDDRQGDRVAVWVTQVVRPPRLRVAHIEQPGELLRAGGQRAALLDHLDLAGEVLGRQCPAQRYIAGLGGVEGRRGSATRRWRRRSPWCAICTALMRVGPVAISSTGSQMPPGLVAGSRQSQCEKTPVIMRLPNLSRSSGHSTSTSSVLSSATQGVTSCS